MNKLEIGYVYLIISFSLIIICYSSLTLRGINLFIPKDYGFDLIGEKYIFYGSIISGLMGYLYLYCEPERDFYKYVLIPSIGLMIIMDLNAVFTLLGLPHSLT